MRPRPPVTVYVTREHPVTGADEFLVFDVPEHPEFSAIVPGGGIEPGERVEETAVREVEEEAGIEVVFVRRLGEIEGAHYVRARPAAPTPDAWEHRREDGAAVRCRWLPVSADARVWGKRGAFVHALVRRRVVGYVTRSRELLVFEHEGVLQVPAGRIDHDETLEEGLVREVAEETGVTRLRIVRELADADEVDRLYGVLPHRTWAFHAAAKPGGLETWEHRVSGSGMDSGLVFRCRWAALDERPLLWGKPDPLLERLRASMDEP